MRVPGALGEKMGRVAAIYNLMPEGPDVVIEEVKERIPSIIPDGIKVTDIQIKPLAFGLKILQVTFVMDDAEGMIDKLEEALKDLEGVQSIEAISVTLI